MIASIQIDPVFTRFVILWFAIVVVGFVLHLLKQPSLITYIIVGVVAGPHVLGLVTDEALISNLGSLGLVLLLFFIGMEIKLPELIGNWRVAVIGTLAQVLISVFVVWLLGKIFLWSINQIVMFGFVISLSSTAVIVKVLQDRKELNSIVGKNVLGILLAQDVFIVPMLILLNYLGGHKPDRIELIKQIIGAVLIIGILILLLKKKELKLPFPKQIIADHELQVFLALTLCFGLATLTAYLGLSSALGAFVAGIILSSTISTEWVHNSLSPFKVVFIALFFVSIGMLIDLQFLYNNALTVVVLVIAVFFINGTINVLIMRLFCKNWKLSLYSGALLAQIGEFSFVIGAIGYYNEIIKDYAYQLILCTIAITLLLSPFVINLTRKYLKMV